MPKRTNDFQRLILLIERQLAPTAEIVESLLLPDATGDLREVDIAVRITSGVHPLLIAIECRDQLRPADITWIDELHGKYRDLKVNQVVAVARSGFTAAASRKGKSLGYRLLSLNEATVSDWAEDVRVLGSVSFATSYTQLTDVFLRFPGKVPLYFRSKIDGQSLRFDQARLARPLSIIELTNHALARTEPQVPTNVLPTSTERESRITLSLPGWVVIDKFRVRHALNDATVTLRTVHASTSIPFTQANYDSAAVAYGSGRIGNLEVQVVCAKSQLSEGSPAIKVSFSPIETARDRSARRHRRH